jgi:quercetin dioxygenase-like cupin family protein
MDNNYIFLQDLRQTHVEPDSIVSHTIQNDARSKIIRFCFGPGQELSAHTAPFPATLYFVKGEAALTLGADQHDAGEGTFVYMPANLEHGIQAKTEVVMLLTMLKPARPA